jgi:predicted metal-dependent hydrolase
MIRRQQQDRVKYGTITIPYRIVKTSRIKTSELIVDANTITVRSPFDKDRSEIKKLVLDKAGWILKKQREYKDTISQITKPSFTENSTIPYLGNNYPVTINGNQLRNDIELVDGKLLVNVKSAKPSSNDIKRLYENWIAEKAPNVLEGKVKKYSETLGVRVKQVVIKDLKNRWGSLTKEGVINLNVNLLKAPEAVVDYIILHELCHLKIKEHSHHYWNLLHKVMPDYSDKEEWLKINGSNLL